MSYLRPTDRPGATQTAVTVRSTVDVSRDLVDAYDRLVDLVDELHSSVSTGAHASNVRALRERLQTIRPRLVLTACDATAAST